MERKAPLNFYKYTSAEVALKIITDMKVRFTQPDLFNDPFEVAPYFDHVITAASIVEKAQQNPGELIRVCGRALEDGVSKVMKMNPGLKRSQISASMQMVMETEGFATALAGLLSGLTRLLDHSMNLGWQSGVSRNIGVLCLSPHPLCELMWAHYGDNHAGVAVVFDAKHDFFHQAGHKAHGFRRVRPVSYKTNRPVLNDLIAKYDLIESDETLLHELFFTKSSAWEYENEYRVLRGLSEVDPMECRDGEKMYLFDIPPEAIQGVIIGANCSNGDKKLLLEATSSAVMRHNVNWAPSVVRPSRSDYKLQLDVI